MIKVEDESESLYYYHYDGLGSVAALSDVNNVVAEKYEYNIFGKLIATLVTEDTENPYYFTGRRLDKETELYHYRARAYAPKLGRFLQTDPIGIKDSLNLYQYCYNNPINYIDPLGLYGGPYFESIAKQNRARAKRQHRDRNKNNYAYPTKQQAENSPFFVKEKSNPFHWPDTYRGIGKYEGSQASYYPDDPSHPDYNPELAGKLDDQTGKMGTYDYSPPYKNKFSHFTKDMWPHFFDDNYTPNLTNIIEENQESLLAPNPPNQPMRRITQLLQDVSREEITNRRALLDHRLDLTEKKGCL